MIIKNIAPSKDYYIINYIKKRKIIRSRYVTNEEKRKC
jgi:hypothetical protein